MKDTTNKNTNIEVISTREFKFFKVVCVKKTDEKGEHYYNNIYLNNILINAYDRKKQNDLAIFVKTYIDYNKD